MKSHQPDEELSLVILKAQLYQVKTTWTGLGKPMGGTRADPGV